MVTLQSFYTLVAIEEEFVHLAAEVHQKWRHESGSNDLQFPVDWVSTKAKVVDEIGMRLSSL